VPQSLTDLSGFTASAEDFLAAVLETAAQPIWVVDPDDLIRFANPAAIATLGYDSADELFGRQSHETIHYRHPDGTPYAAADCPMLLPRATGETVESDLDCGRGLHRHRGALARRGGAPRARCRACSA
jgi:PAS domain-containing protein